MGCFDRIGKLDQVKYLTGLLPNSSSSRREPHRPFA